MTVEVVRTVDGLHDLEPGWRSLQEAAGTLPFTSWEWNIAWWRHLSRQGFVSNDRLFVLAMRRQGALVGIAPLMLSERPARGPRIRCLRYFGVDQNITELTGPLCGRADESEFHHTLLDYIFEHRTEWDCAILDGLREDGDGPSTACRYAKPVWAPDVENFLLPLAPTWREFKAGRSRNIKESLRKCTNSLKRDGLSPTFRVVSDKRGLRQILGTFLELHATRAALRNTVIHDNVFAKPEARSFLYELAERCSAAEKMRIFSMEIDGRPVAVRITLVAGQSLYLYYSGYDPQYAKYGVMTHVVAHAIRYAIESGFHTVNLSSGKDVSKTRWSPTQTTFRRAILGSHSRFAAQATALYSRLSHLWRTRASWNGRSAPMTAGAAANLGRADARAQR
jgi:CelD/BcsL family acetyltransferase involved in cellulose biosynthesis